MNTKEPLIILNNNKPEVVVIDIGTYHSMREKLADYEQQQARQAITSYKNEKESNKLKKLHSLAQIENED